MGDKMKVEGVKKWNLILSSLLCLSPLILYIPHSLLQTSESSLLFTVTFTTGILFLSGILFLVYYFAKKEEMMSKILAITNILAPIPFWFRYNLGITYFFILLPFILSLIFNFYLYWSKDVRK